MFINRSANEKRMRWAITILSWTRAVMDALLRHARAPLLVFCIKLKKTIRDTPEFDNLVSAAERMLPVPKSLG